VSPVENCSPPEVFHNKKKMERLIRNNAKDLRHYSWQVRELLDAE